MFGPTYQDPLNAELLKLGEDVLKTQKGAVEPPPPPPIKFNVRGREIVANSPEELSAMLETTLQQFEQALVASQANTYTATDPEGTAGNEGPGRYVTGSETEEKFDKKEYFSLLEKDPLNAAAYVDQHRFGVKDPVEYINTLAKDLEEQRKVTAIYQFKERHPEYPGGAHNAQVVEKVLEKIGLGYTPEGLEAAWALAKESGIAQVARPQQLPGQGYGYPPGYTGYGPGQMAPPNGQTFTPQQHQQRQYPYAAGPYGTPSGPMDPRFMSPYGQGFAPQAPPMLGRGGMEPSPDVIDMAEKMSPDQLQEMIRRLESGIKNPGV